MKLFWIIFAIGVGLLGLLLLLWFIDEISDTFIFTDDEWKEEDGE